MSMDKKQSIAGEMSDSASSLPLFSPIVDKDISKSIDFSAAAIGFQSCELLDGEPSEHSFQSLHLIANQSLPNREGEAQEGEPERCLSKEEKKSKLGISLECVPMLPREKISMAEEAFEVPQLTAESLISSEEIDLDSECNANDLPLCSTRRYKIERVFHEQSEGSDQCEDRSKAYLAKQDYAESKGSDRSESDDFPTICKLCYVLVEKSKMLESQNAELIKETQAAKEQLLKLQEKNRKLAEQKEEQLHLENLPPYIIKERFLAQIQQACKTLVKVNEHLSAYSFDFRGKDCEQLQRFNLEFRKLEEEVLGRADKECKRKQIEQLHNSYKKIITRLIKDFEERESKKEVDFKRFFSAIARRSPPEPPRSLQIKSERSRRKSKTYAEKEDSADMDLIENNKQWEQSRQRLEWLQLAFTREKENWQQMERGYFERLQRCQTQLGEMTHERNIYRSLAGQYAQQFSDFMHRLTKQQCSSITQSEFFRTLSQRVFQISNCIPFEDNDEQNLFAPENQEELFEMLERICRFYRRIEDYNLQRDSQFQAEKNGFMRFLRELVEQNRVQPKMLLDTLEGNNYSGLGYLKELIRSSRQSEKEQAVPQRQSIGNRILKIQRTKSFTISSHGIQYCP